MDVEVTRVLFGTMAQADKGGKIDRLDYTSDPLYGVPSGLVIDADAASFNPLSRVFYARTIAPGAHLNLNYDWSTVER